MKKLYIYQGLPSSGKSTVSSEVIQKDQKTRRVERDALRQMLFGKLWTGKGVDEKIVTKAQKALIRLLLEEGYNVISSDTNLNPDTVKELSNLAKSCSAEVEINSSFLKISVDECIKRDLARPNSVGEQVIRDFARKYLRQPKKIVQNKTLPKAIIVDLDGTACIMGDRSPYDWHKVGVDLPNEHVISAIDGYYLRGYKIIFLSGRDGICMPQTIEWLEKYTHIHYQEDFELFMRSINDQRRDSIIKKELFMKHVYNQYYIEAVFDDRQQVIRECWKELGLNVFRCGIIDEDNF